MAIIWEYNSFSTNWPRANYLGDNFQGMNFLERNYPGEAIILGVNCPGGNYPGGNCPVPFLFNSVNNYKAIITFQKKIESNISDWIKKKITRANIKNQKR